MVCFSEKMASEQEKVGKASSEKGKRLTQEQIVAGFNQLRQEQRTLVTKLTDLEQEFNEHSLVVEALQKVDADRKCYRMVGGILVERTVKEVLPAVANNKEQLSKVLESMNHQIEVKGKELNDYREKYGIHIRGEPANMDATMSQKSAQVSEPTSSSSSVLVESQS